MIFQLDEVCMYRMTMDVSFFFVASPGVCESAPWLRLVSAGFPCTPEVSLSLPDFFLNLSYMWGSNSRVCYESSFLFRYFVTFPALKDVKHSSHMIMFMCGTLTCSVFFERVIDKLVLFFSYSGKARERAGEENDCCFNSAPYPSISVFLSF